MKMITTPSQFFRKQKLLLGVLLGTSFSPDSDGAVLVDSTRSRIHGISVEFFSAEGKFKGWMVETGDSSILFNLGKDQNDSIVSVPISDIKMLKIYEYKSNTGNGILAGAAVGFLFGVMMGSSSSGGGYVGEDSAPFLSGLLGAIPGMIFGGVFLKGTSVYKVNLHGNIKQYSALRSWIRTFSIRKK